MAAAQIALHGGAWFRAVGTPKSAGTKLLSVSGDVARPGIYEYPLRRDRPAGAGGRRRPGHAGRAGRRPLGRAARGHEFGRASPSRTCPARARSWSSTSRATSSRSWTTSPASSPTRAAASARPAAWAPPWSKQMMERLAAGQGSRRDSRTCEGLAADEGREPLRARPHAGQPGGRRLAKFRPRSTRCRLLEVRPVFDLDERWPRPARRPAATTRAPTSPETERPHERRARRPSASTATTSPSTRPDDPAGRAGRRSTSRTCATTPSSSPTGAARSARSRSTGAPAASCTTPGQRRRRRGRVLDTPS
jgi:[NiFe] hydrogenase diaphorase moiety large subunit